VRFVPFAVVLWAGLATAQVPINQGLCARRIIKTLNIRPEGYDLSTAPPQSMVRTWLQDPKFVPYFALYVNSKLNGDPLNRFENVEAAMLGVPFIFANDRPWKELFTGHWVFTDTGYKTLVEDASAPALGIFNDMAWLIRYQGNEREGYLLRGAYRILQNTTGLVLAPSPNNAVGDNGATGRERAECRGCHYDSPYALDKIARLLPRRVGIGDAAMIVPATPVPQTLFAPQVTIADEETLVRTLVDSEAFTFWSCRLAFQFAYGRRESACEAPIFDRCAAAFEQTGKMTDALATFLEDPAYCEAAQ
jgi:hypothetical protein